MNEQTNINECSICWEKIDTEYKTTCNHLFHKNCVDEWLKNNNTCPICRSIIKQIKPVNINTIVPININQPIINQNRFCNNYLKIILYILYFAYIIATIYNLIVYIKINSYINTYYNSVINNSSLIILFLLCELFLLLFIPFFILSPKKSACLCFTIILAYSLSLYCHITDYKIYHMNFNILSLTYKIHLLLSEVLFVFFHLIIIIVLCLSCIINNI